MSEEPRDWSIDAKRSLKALAVGGVAGALTGNIVSGAVVGVMWWLMKPYRTRMRPDLLSEPARCLAVCGRQLKRELELVEDRPLDRRDLETKYEVRWFQARTRHGVGHPECTLAAALYASVLLHHDRRLPERLLPELCQDIETVPAPLRRWVYELLACAPDGPRWIETLGERLEAEHPEEVATLHLVLARRARQEGDYEEARGWIDRAKERMGSRRGDAALTYRRLELTPPPGEEALEGWIALHVELARICQAAGELEAAHDAVASLPVEGLCEARRLEVLLWRSGTLHDAGRTGEALAFLREAHPGPVWKLELERARLLLDLGEIRAARDAARRGRSGSTEFRAEDWAVLARVEVEGGDQARGLRDRERATLAARGERRTLEELAPDLEVAVALADERPLEALAVAQRAVVRAQRSWGEEHVFVVDALGLEARACRALGDRRRAEKLVRQGLELVQRQLGSRHPSRAKLLDLLAGIVGEPSLRDEAAALRLEALK